MDAFGVRSQNLAEKAIANGCRWAREITPSRLPDGSVVEHDGRHAAGSPGGPVIRAQAGVRAGRSGVPPQPRENCCPLNAAPPRVVNHVRHKARKWDRTLARIVSTGVTGLSPEIMGCGPIGGPRRRGPRRSASEDIDLVAEPSTGLRAQVIPSARGAGGTHSRESSTCRWCDRGRPPVRMPAPDRRKADHGACRPATGPGLETSLWGGCQGMRWSSNACA